MTDDRRPNRRARTHGDARDRHRTDPRGLPAYVPEELTPPPSEPPRPESLEGYATIAPPIREQLATIHEGQAQLVEAIGKVWPLRDGAWIERIESALGSIAKSVTRHEALLDDMLVPQLDRWRATTDQLAQQMPRLLFSIESMTSSVDMIERRVRAVEITVEKLVERITGDSDDVEKAIERATQERAEMRLHIRALQDTERDRQAASQALAKVDRKKSRLNGGGAGAVVGGIIAAVIAALK